MIKVGDKLPAGKLQDWPSAPQAVAVAGGVLPVGGGGVVPPPPAPG